MNVMINVESLMDSALYMNDCYAEYRVKAERLNRTRDSHMADIDEWLMLVDRARYDAEHAWDNYEEAKSIVWGIEDVLRMGPEQCERYMNAARSVRKWREKTDYAYLMSDDMQEACLDYIFNNKEVCRGYSKDRV